MSDAVMEVIRQAKGLSVSEKREVAMALLAQTEEVETQMPTHKWAELRGLYPYPMFGEDAQIAINRMRGEWDEREKQWSQPE